MTRDRAALRVLAGLTAVAVLGLTGCGTGPGGGGGAPAGGGGPQKTIGVSVADQKSLFYVAEVAGIQAEAQKKGVKVVVTSANNNSSQQVSQVNDLLTQQVGALIFTSQDSTAAAAGVRAANQANVPVVERGGRDRARWPAALVQDAARVTGVGHVVANLCQELREAEYVGVDAQPNRGRAVVPLVPSAAGHGQAARRAVS